MKLLYAVLAGLLGVAATSGVAEAQWSSDSAWRDGARYGYAPDGARASLARAAHVLAGEAEALADALHAVAPRSRVARDAMGVALVAERFHRTVESGAPARVIARDLAQLRREIRQLAAIAATHPARGRFPGVERRIEGVVDAFRIADRIAQGERYPRRGRAYAAPVVRAVPAPVVRARPHLSVRVGL